MLPPKVASLMNAAKLVSYLYRIMLSHLREKFGSWKTLKDKSSHPAELVEIYNLIVSENEEI